MADCTTFPDALLNGLLKPLKDQVDSTSDLNKLAIAAEEIARAFAVPEMAVLEALAPLSEFIGGRLVKLALPESLRRGVGLVLLESMLRDLVEYQKNGTPGCNAFAGLLARAGLHGDASFMLAGLYAQDTDVDSARTSAKKMAAKLQALPEQARLRALFQSLAAFHEYARSALPDYGVSSTSKSKNKYLFDNVEPKQFVKSTAASGQLAVVLKLVTRANQGDSAAQMLKAYHHHCGSLLNPHTTVELPAVPEAVGFDEPGGDYLFTVGRAQILVSDPNCEKVVDALDALAGDLLFGDSGGSGSSSVAPIAPRLQWKLKHIYRQRHAYISVLHNKGSSRLRAGMVKRNGRVVAPVLHGLVDGGSQAPNWISLDNLTKETFSELQLVPKPCHEPGLLEFYLLVSDIRPPRTLALPTGFLEGKQLEVENVAAERVRKVYAEVAEGRKKSRKEEAKTRKAKKQRLDDKKKQERREAGRTRRTQAEKKADDEEEAALNAAREAANAKIESDVKEFMEKVVAEAKACTKFVLKVVRQRDCENFRAMLLDASEVDLCVKAKDHAKHAQEVARAAAADAARQRAYA